MKNKINKKISIEIGLAFMLVVASLTTIAFVTTSINDDAIYASDLFTQRTIYANEVGNDEDFKLSFLGDTTISDFNNNYNFNNHNTNPNNGVVSWLFGTCEGPSCDEYCGPTSVHDPETCQGGITCIPMSTCQPGQYTCSGTCAIDTCDGWTTCDPTCAGSGAHTCWCIHETCDNQGACTGS